MIIRLAWYFFQTSVMHLVKKIFFYRMIFITLMSQKNKKHTINVFINLLFLSWVSRNRVRLENKKVWQKYGQMFSFFQRRTLNKWLFAPWVNSNLVRVNPFSNIRNFPILRHSCSCLFSGKGSVECLTFGSYLFPQKLQPLQIEKS